MASNSDQLKHIWLREETSDSERRTPLTPQDAGKLIERGFKITVEKSHKRVFPDEEYAKFGKFKFSSELKKTL
jgi:saccharopine dehydrogenase (NAD+, L-lysine-forming)